MRFPLDSLRIAANKYPGGLPVLAMRLEKSPEVLRKELAGSSANHKLGFLDAMQLCELLTEAGVPLDTMMESFKSACGADATEGDGGAFPCLLTLSSNSVKEASDAVAAVAESLRDNHLGDNDLQRCEKECREVIEAVHRLRKAARMRHAQDNAGRGVLQ